MIKVLTDDYKRLGVIKNVIEASRVEELNGENTLEFSAILDSKIGAFVTSDTIFELNNDYFDVALFYKNSNEDGTYTVKVETEHVSYRLNDPKYNVDSFLGVGSPTNVVGRILQGTGFTIRIVDFDSAASYDIREARSRRRLLMDYVDFLDGEIIFNKFDVSIVKKRGDQNAKLAVKDNNVRVISQEVNKRKNGNDGAPLVSYTCKPLNLPSDSYVLGDAITLIDKNIGVREDLRVVRIMYNPYMETEVEITFGTYINGFEAPVYDISNDSGSDVDPEVLESIVKDVIDKTPLADIMATYVYSDTGVFSNAIVKRLRTDLSKPWRYLNGNTSDVHYQDIGDTDISSGRYFKVDYCQPDLEPIQYTVPSISEGGEEIPLWWYEGNVGGGLTTSEEHSKNSEDESTPAMCYQYTTGVQHRSELRQTSEGWWGVRDQWGIGVDEFGRGAGVIEKTGQHMFFGMDQGQGDEIGGFRVSVENGPEYYDTDSKTWVKPGGSGGDGSSVIIERLI